VSWKTQGGGVDSVKCLSRCIGYRDSQRGKENMNVGIFEKLTAFNRCMDDVVMILKAYETTPGFDQGSVEIYTREAEQLKASVTRYVGEAMIREADETAVRLDGVSEKKPEEET
jgi:hypothetical protein